MSSVPEGWYVDPSTGTNLRWWSGSTWTDEVAPLPYEPAHSGQIDLFGASAAAEAVPEESVEEAAGSIETDEPAAELDPDLELTHLTRRELRARRGENPVPDDAPKHLPPIAPPVAVSIEEWTEPAEELEITVDPALAQPDEATTDADPARRKRIVRMSVLLGVLAVATSVAVLTAGTL